MTDGSVVEIGVHHGKSFILLALANRSRHCYAIDLFQAQDLNIDRSGQGDREKFLGNLQSWGADADKVVIDARPSDTVTAEDIITKVGRSRFFHIDGAHHLQVVSSDLALALATTDAAGIIAIDDVFMPEWPDVSIALFGSPVLAQSGFVPFAIGFNKTYLCHRDQVARYRAVLKETSILRAFFAKNYDIGTTHLDVYQRYPLPEWGAYAWAKYFLSTYFPELAARLRQ
jgi:hypothetical protein